MILTQLQNLVLMCDNIMHYAFYLMPIFEESVMSLTLNKSFPFIPPSPRPEL